MSSLLKVIGESPSLIRSNPNARNPLDDGRISPTPESNRKRLLQEKFEERKKDLSSNSCQTKCFLFPSPDLTIFYIPNEWTHQSIVNSFILFHHVNKSETSFFFLLHRNRQNNLWFNPEGQQRKPVWHQLAHENELFYLRGKDNHSRTDWFQGMSLSDDQPWRIIWI